MLESMKKISNPLTIIGIFACLAEISGTIVLGSLKDQNQLLYVWFLMGFPTLLIVLFFLTLNFNHEVLYAPSDFQNEDNFLKFFAKPTPEESLSKLDDELYTKPEAASATPADNEVEQPDLKYRVVGRSALAQKLVVRKLAKEFDEVDEEVMLRAGTSRFLFDAIAKKGKRVFVIEVKYLKSRGSFMNVKSSFLQIQHALSSLPEDISKSITIVLAFATEIPTDQFSRVEKEVRSTIRDTAYPIEVRIFNLLELEKELPSHQST